MLARLDEKVGNIAETSTAVRQAVLDELERLLRDQPHSLRTRKRRAELLTEWGPQESALADLDYLEEAYGPTPELTALRGVALYKTKRKAEAHATCRAVLAEDRRNEVALLHIGLMLAEKGEFGAASRYFARVVDIDPDNSSAQSFLAVAHRASGASDEGDGDGTSAIDPDHLKPGGLVLLEAGKVRGGIDLLLEALRSSPEDIEILNALARGFSSRGMYPTATEVLDQVVAIEPRDVDAHVALGLACSRAGETNATFLLKAAKCYETSLSLGADPQPTHVRVARTYARAGDLEKAIQHFDTALQEEPRPETYLDYGIFLSRNADLQAATDMYERGLGEHPEHPDLLAHLMAVHFEAGNVSLARALRRRLETLKVLSPPARSLLMLYGGTS